MSTAQSMKYIENLQTLILDAKFDKAQGAYLPQNIAYIQQLETEIRSAIHPKKYAGVQTLREFS